MNYKIIERFLQGYSYSYFDFLVKENNVFYSCPYGSIEISRIVRALLSRDYNPIEKITYDTILSNSRIIFESNDLNDFRNFHITYPELFL